MLAILLYLCPAQAIKSYSRTCIYSLVLNTRHSSRMFDTDFPNDKMVVFILCTAFRASDHAQCYNVFRKLQAPLLVRTHCGVRELVRPFYRETGIEGSDGIGGFMHRDSGAAIWEWTRLHAHRQTHRQRYSTRDTHMLQCGKCGTYIFNVQTHIPNYMNYIPSTNIPS